MSRVIEQNLAPGDVFVDIGANIGYDTLLAASRVGAQGTVISIEASPRTFALLQRDIAANPFAANVRAVNAAVSDRPARSTSTKSTKPISVRRPHSRRAAAR